MAVTRRTLILKIYHSDSNLLITKLKNWNMGDPQVPLLVLCFHPSFRFSSLIIIIIAFPSTFSPILWVSRNQSKQVNMLTHLRMKISMIIKLLFPCLIFTFSLSFVVKTRILIDNQVEYLLLSSINRLSPRKHINYPLRFLQTISLERNN